MRIIGLLLTAAALVLISPPAESCGHDGWYVGVGYTQRHLYSPDRQLTIGGLPSDRVKFGPGYGGHFLVGYDFCGTRFGLQVPLEYSNHRLNRVERVHFLSAMAEPILHIAAWQNGLDFHLIGGLGYGYLTEGSRTDRSASHAFQAGIGPGLTWYFSREEESTAAFTIASPLRAILFQWNHLSSNATVAFDVPIRANFTIGF